MPPILTEEPPEPKESDEEKEEPEQMVDDEPEDMDANDTDGDFEEAEGKLANHVIMQCIELFPFV